MPPTATPQTVLQLVEQAFDRARGVWTGCDWPTTFGATRLDLNGISSYQALLMARATAGAEGADWQAAVDWLRRVERAAADAADAARRAVDAVARGDFVTADREVRAAYELEAEFHPLPKWAELCRLVQGARTGDR